MDMKLTWGNASSLRESNQNEEFVIVNQQFINSFSVFNVQKGFAEFQVVKRYLLSNCRDHGRFLILNRSAS